MTNQGFRAPQLSSTSTGELHELVYAPHRAEPLHRAEGTSRAEQTTASS
jgi:hypothetical protein